MNPCAALLLESSRCCCVVEDVCAQEDSATIIEFVEAAKKRQTERLASLQADYKRIAPGKKRLEIKSWIDSVKKNMPAPHLPELAPNSIAGIGVIGCFEYPLYVSQVVNEEAVLCYPLGPKSGVNLNAAKYTADRLRRGRPPTEQDLLNKEEDKFRPTRGALVYLRIGTKGLTDGDLIWPTSPYEVSGVHAYTTRWWNEKHRPEN